MRILFIVFLFCSSKVYGHLTSDFDMHIGYTNLTINVGDSYNRTLTSASTFQANYNLNFSGNKLAMNLIFTETLSSNLGTLAYTRMGAGLRFYPMGANGIKLIIDNGVYGKVWRPTIFLGGNLGMASLAVDDDSDEGFNAIMFDIQLNAGLEVPISQSWLFMGQLGFMAALNAESSLDENNSVNYNGLQILLGMRMNFL